jgi:hypothetical protein
MAEAGGRPATEHADVHRVAFMDEIRKPPDKPTWSTF